MGAFLRDVMREERDEPEFPRLRAGRNGLQPAAGLVRGDGRAWDARTVPDDDDTSRRRAG